MKKYDIVIIGAGAAGLSAAAAAKKRNRTVAIIDMGDKPARKIMASGGGRCNFTNLSASKDTYFGLNPDFVRSAITRTSPVDILNWAKTHNIKWIEKAPGQYFCKNGAADIVNALIQETGNTETFLNALVNSVQKQSDGFHIYTKNCTFLSDSLIIASGGISFPALGVSDIGYKIAKQFGHKVIPVRPALCAIKTDIFSPELSGISIDVDISIEKQKIRDSMLFTHFGVGGPAIYRATVRNFNKICINLLPQTDVYEFLRSVKKSNGRKTISNALSEKMPNRLAKWLCSDPKHIADYKDSELKEIANNITNIVLSSNNITLHSLQSAEVVRGGVDTSQISSKTMESKLCSGLFFAGEVLDVAGDLGGFNLHWAWASGNTAGENA